MIHTSVVAFILAAAAAANIARAQETVASLFPVGFEDDGLVGSAIGTGAEGTTYVLSGTFDTLGLPVTVTLLEGPSIISENAIIATAGVTLTMSIECGIGSDDLATCTEAIIEPDTTTFVTDSGEVDLVPITLGGSGSGQSTVSASTSASGSSSTEVSTLSAQISVTSSTTTKAASSSRSATVISASASATSVIGSNSGALGITDFHIFPALVASFAVVAGAAILL